MRHTIYYITEKDLVYYKSINQSIFPELAALKFTSTLFGDRLVINHNTSKDEAKKDLIRFYSDGLYFEKLFGEVKWSAYFNYFFDEYKPQHFYDYIEGKLI